MTTGSYFSADLQAKNVASKIAPLSPANGGAAAHRVASIVVETDKKGRCEERRFDNRSGKIVSATLVDCEARLANERDTTPSENLERRADARDPRRIQAIRERSSVTLKNNVLHHRIDLLLPALA